jgi:hypothetical protein
MSTSLKVATVFACLLLVPWSAGCGNSSPSTTAPSSTATSPTTETFSSILYVGSAVSRTFTLSTAGTVTATLVSAAPPPTIVVGFGVGIPLLNGAGCLLSTSVNTAAGPAAQVTAAVGTGAYCVQVFDPGSITDPVSFSVNIVHP